MGRPGRNQDRQSKPQGLRIEIIPNSADVISSWSGKAQRTPLLFPTCSLFLEVLWTRGAYCLCICFWQGAVRINKDLWRLAVSMPATFCKIWFSHLRAQKKKKSKKKKCLWNRSETEDLSRSLCGSDSVGRWLERELKYPARQFYSYLLPCTPYSHFSLLAHPYLSLTLSQRYCAILREIFQRSCSVSLRWWILVKRCLCSLGYAQSIICFFLIGFSSR